MGVFENFQQWRAALSDPPSEVNQYISNKIRQLVKTADIFRLGLKLVEQ